MAGRARSAVRRKLSEHRGVATALFREKDWAVLVRIPLSSVESGPTPRGLDLATWRGEANSFAQLVFLVSRAWVFQQQRDSALERSQLPARGFWLIAEQIARSLLPQRVLLPLAFLQG